MTLDLSHIHTFSLAAYSTQHKIIPTTPSYPKALMPTVTFRRLMKQKVRPLNGPMSRINS